VKRRDGGSSRFDRPGPAGLTAAEFSRVGSTSLVWLAEPVPLVPGGTVRMVGYDSRIGMPEWLAEATSSQPLAA